MNVSVSMSTSSNGSNAVSGPPPSKAAGITTRSTFVLAVAFVGAFSPNCFAQKDPMDEAIQQARAKFGVTVTLGDVRQECAGPRAMALNDWINREGKSSAEAESSIERAFGLLVANDPSTQFFIARREAKKVSKPFQNFIVCVSKISWLQLLKVGDADNSNDVPGHIDSAGSRPKGGGRYFRINQSQWLLIKEEDIDQYMAYIDKKNFEIRDGKSKIVATRPPKVSMAAGQDPYGKVGEGGPNDPTHAPAPRPGNGSPGLGVGIIGAPLPKLSSAQVAACSDEIRRTQLASQGWAGDANDVAARLGQFQKGLFEGRCAGHPEAQAYIAGANKMLGYGGNAAGSGGGSQSGTSSQRTRSGSVNEGTSSGNLAPIRRDTQSTEHNPVHNATNCIKIYDPSEIKALGLQGTVLPTKMVNTCPYSVSVTWCVVAKDGRPGDCNPGYSNLLNLSGTGEKGSNSYGVNAYYQEVRYAACRYGKNMGFQRVEKDSGNPFRFSCS